MKRSSYHSIMQPDLLLCEQCRALISADYRDEHDRWHKKLRIALLRGRRAIMKLAMKEPLAPPEK